MSDCKHEKTKCVPNNYDSDVPDEILLCESCQCEVAIICADEIRGMRHENKDLRLENEELRVKMLTLQQIFNDWRFNGADHQEVLLRLGKLATNTEPESECSVRSGDQYLQPCPKCGEE